MCLIKFFSYFKFISFYLIFKVVECQNNTNYNWTLYKNKCYYVSKGVEDEKLSWLKSRDFCRNIGGDLLSIHTVDELAYVTSIVFFCQKYINRKNLFNKFNLFLPKLSK